MKLVLIQVLLDTEGVRAGFCADFSYRSGIGINGALEFLRGIQDTRFADFINHTRHSMNTAILQDDLNRGKQFGLCVLKKTDSWKQAQCFVHCKIPLQAPSKYLKNMPSWPRQLAFYRMDALYWRTWSRSTLVGLADKYFPKAEALVGLHVSYRCYVTRLTDAWLNVYC